MRVITSLAALALMAAAPAMAQDHAMDEKAIMGMTQAYERAWGAGNAKAIAALYTADGMFTVAQGRTMTGRAEIEQGTMESLMGPYKGSTLTIHPAPIAWLSPTIALGSGEWAIMQNGETMMAGKYLGVWVKVSNAWLIRGLQSMVPMEMEDEEHED
ncbi:MAG: SgcJ/EcaC family oxidoreductase [Gemmatimonadales bacterium]